MEVLRSPVVGYVIIHLQLTQWPQGARTQDLLQHKVWRMHTWCPLALIDPCIFLESFQFCMLNRHPKNEEVNVGATPKQKHWKGHQVHGESMTTIY